MRIELLYFEDCPHYLPTLDRLREALRGADINVDVIEVEVTSAAAAERLRFIGSPTIRINGMDIEAGARSEQRVGLACRRYPGDLPSEEIIRAALREACRSK